MASLTRLVGAVSFFVLTAGAAYAHDERRPASVSVPEIDASQGLAALAILFCVGLIIRERFLREAPAKS